MSRIVFLTAGAETVASSRVRVYQYLKHLTRAGWDSRVVPYSTDLGRRARNGSRLRLHERAVLRSRPVWRAYGRWFQVAARVRFERLAKTADVLFIQKVLLPLEAQQRLKRLRKPIVFDLDDALYSSDLYARNLLDAQIEASDLVTVVNDCVAAYVEGLGRPVLRIPGPVDTNHYVPRDSVPSGGQTIGWIGSPEGCVYLNSITPALRRLRRAFPEMRLLLVGALGFEADGIRAEVVPWQLEDERRLLHEFDVGIMPLPDDEWARAKGGYKLLQYMACGIPCVASAVGINRLFVRHGENGYLAETLDDWVASAGRLLRDENERIRMGRAGRHRAVAEFSCEKAAPVLISALESLVRGGAGLAAPFDVRG